MIHESHSFGARLRAERERRGISLDSIAVQTKIQKAFLESLERGDFSKWPAGEVFRRAYIRDYAAAVGLAPDSVLGEFIRLAPAGDEAPPREQPPLAITFDRSPSWRERILSPVALAAVLDAGGLLGLGALSAHLMDVGLWTATGVLAFAYYPVATLIWGCSPATRIVDPRRRLRREFAGEVAASLAQTSVDTIASSARSIQGSAAHAGVGRIEAVVMEPLLLGGPDASASSHAAQASAAH